MIFRTKRRIRPLAKWGAGFSHREERSIKETKKRRKIKGRRNGLKKGGDKSNYLSPYAAGEEKQNKKR